MTPSQRQELHIELSRLAAGDRRALDPLFEVLSPIVRRFVARQLRDSADADDTAQQALLKIFERASEFDPAFDALSWVLGVTAWEVRTTKRRMYRQSVRRVTIELEVATSRGSPEEAVVQKNLLEAVTELFGSLAPADVETLVSLAHGDRPSIAAATFRKRVQRALARIRMMWRTKHDLG